MALIKKKGFVYGSSDATTATKINALNVGWFYNWNFVRNPGIDNLIPYTPIVWGTKTANNADAIKIINQIDTPGYDNNILGFNEPDFSQQSNMTVDQAIALWPIIQKTGRRIGSPAVAKNPTDPNGWLAQFMQKAKELNYRVDFIAIHWYAPPNVKSLLTKIDALWATYGLPIWITEFAVADWNANATTPCRFTQTQVKDFMAQVIPELESRSYVERYCWKTRNTSDINMGVSAIFNDDGTLTDLGTLYASL
jgi:hypothetical protein